MDVTIFNRIIFFFLLIFRRPPVSHRTAQLFPYSPIVECYLTAKGFTMAAPTPKAIETALRKVQQAKARLQALEARAATLNRKADARRKIILGGLLLDA